MPDRETLARMYGSDYGSSFVDVEQMDDAEDRLPVTALLKSSSGGVFIDYGCGGGGLLIEAAKLNWRAVGVEFDRNVAEITEKATGSKVFSHEELGSLNGLRADVLHLGDVIEHLTELNARMPEILSLVKPGGLLVARGPLEGNANLFLAMVRLGRAFRRGSRTEMAPYHVLLATARGQRLLFRRFGLKEIDFRVREVSWPAADRLTLSNIRRPRSLGLFLLRRISQAVSRLGPSGMGNRYFYVGRKDG